MQQCKNTAAQLEKSRQGTNPFFLFSFLPLLLLQSICQLASSLQLRLNEEVLLLIPSLEKKFVFNSPTQMNFASPVKLEVKLYISSIINIQRSCSAQPFGQIKDGSFLVNAQLNNILGVRHYNPLLMINRGFLVLEIVVL